MSVKIQMLTSSVKSFLFWLKEFLFSFVSEENCRACRRMILVQPQIMHYGLPETRQSKGALLHNWIADKPHYSRVICQECWSGLVHLKPMLHFVQLDEQTQLPIVSGSAYSGIVKQLIYGLKYKSDRLITSDLATVMLQGWRMASLFVEREDVVMVPVPLHWRRQLKRGFNQSELIANEASKILKVPVVKNALKRRRWTNIQQQLEKSDRLSNVRGAFKGNRRRIRGKVVILIDDVCTSGATLSECAKEAIRCGATRVIALTIAFTILRKDPQGALGLSNIDSDWEVL